MEGGKLIKPPAIDCCFYIENCLALLASKQYTVKTYSINFTSFYNP